MLMIIPIFNADTRSSLGFRLASVVWPKSVAFPNCVPWWQTKDNLQGRFLLKDRTWKFRGRMTPRDTVVVKRMKMMMYFWNRRYCTASGPIRPCRRFSWKVRIFGLLGSLLLDLLLCTSWLKSSLPLVKCSSPGLATKLPSSSAFVSWGESHSSPSLTSSDGSLSLDEKSWML